MPIESGRTRCPRCAAWTGYLFLEPPADPDFGDDTELRRFAHDVLTPMVERAVSAHP